MFHVAVTTLYLERVSFPRHSAYVSRTLLPRQTSGDGWAEEGLRNTTTDFRYLAHLLRVFNDCSDRSVVPRFYMNNLEIARCTDMLCCFNVKPKVARLQILFS